MNDKMVLVKFDSNYADEFDVRGFVVMTATEWDRHKVLAEKVFVKKANVPLSEPDQKYSRRNEQARRVAVYFGTNEAIVYANFKEYLSSFEVVELDEYEYATLKKLFTEWQDGPIGSGTVAMLDAAIEDDEMEDDEVGA